MGNNTSTKIDGLTRLRMEKSQLKSYCTYQEKLIGLKIDYFRENYSEVLSNAMLPYDRAQNSKANNLLDTINDLIAILLPQIFKGKFLPKMVLKLVEILTIWTFRKAKG